MHVQLSVQIAKELLKPAKQRKTWGKILKCTKTHWTSWGLQAFEQCFLQPWWSGTAENSYPMHSHRKTAEVCSLRWWPAKAKGKQAGNVSGSPRSFLQETWISMAGVLVCVLLVHWHHVVPMQINCSRRICCTWHRFVLRAVIQMGMFRYQDPCCLSWSCSFLCQNQIALSQMGTRLGQNALAGPHFPRSVLALSNSFLCLKTHLDIDIFFFQ